MITRKIVGTVAQLFSNNPFLTSPRAHISSITAHRTLATFALDFNVGKRLNGSKVAWNDSATKKKLALAERRREIEEVIDSSINESRGRA